MREATVDLAAGRRELPESERRLKVHINMKPDGIKGYLEALANGLAPLVSKMQMSAEQIWLWALRHNYAMAIKDAAITVVAVVYLCCYYKFLRYCLTPVREGSDYRNWDSEETYQFFAVMGGVLSGVAVVMAFTCGDGAIMRFIAPEWSTAEDLIKLMRGGN